MIVSSGFKTIQIHHTSSFVNANTSLYLVALHFGHAWNTLEINRRSQCDYRLNRPPVFEIVSGLVNWYMNSTTSCFDLKPYCVMIHRI